MTFTQIVFGPELLYFVLMIGTFIALLMLAKLPSGICLMASAVVGAVASALISKTDFALRYFVEGTFAYFDTILIITVAMIFMGAMQSSGALEYISAAIVKKLRKYPTLLLICFMLIIMFPAMVTGSSLASAIASGALLAPIMIKWGIPKAKAGAIVATGSILGMVSPPINVPAMVICDVVDIPYVNFTLPLLVLALPIAIVTVVLLGRKYVKPIEEDQIDKVVDTKVLTELKWTVCIPMFVLIALIVGEIVLPKYFGVLGMVVMFVIATILSFFFGRKLPFLKSKEEKVEVKEGEEPKPNTVVEVISAGVKKSFSAMGLLMGVGMFMEIITLNGVRGYFATIAVSIQALAGETAGNLSMILTLPIFGGISAFGSASVLGGPFVMMLNGIGANVTVTCGLSLLAALGEFMPPTAMSATFASQMVEEKKWSSVTKAAIPSMAMIFVYSSAYTICLGRMIQETSKANVNGLYVAVLGVAIAVAILFAIFYPMMAKKLPKKIKDLIPTLAIVFTYASLFTIWFGNIVKDDLKYEAFKLNGKQIVVVGIILAVIAVILIAFAFIYPLIAAKKEQPEQAEEAEQEEAQPEKAEEAEQEAQSEKAEEATEQVKEGE